MTKAYISNRIMVLSGEIMKLKYINGKFDYKNKVKILRESPVKKILILSLAASLTLTGCSVYDDINDYIGKTTVIEGSEVSSKNVENTEKQTPISKEPKIETEQSNVDLNNNQEKTIVEKEPIVSEKKQEEVAQPSQKQEKKLVAITFDDGPSKYTSELVEILSINGVKATFFLIGSNINKYSDSVVKAYQAGNEIGIHTYSHTSFTKMSIEQIQNELAKTRTLLDGIDVDYSNIVRPPYGNINKNIQDSIDTSFILWSVDTRDWESRNKDAVIAEVKKNISEGSIILFHDVYPTTIQAIKEVLPELTKDYEFVTVSELFEQNDKTLDENQKYYKVKK